MPEMIHAYYEAHRGAMEAAMRQRLDLAEPMLRQRAHLTDLDGIRQEVMDEFEIVLAQMPYVGGAASLKLRCRAAASKARSALSGGRA